MVTENRAKVASLVREAKAELQKGNRDEAFIILRKALSMDPGSSAVTEAILAIEKELMFEKEKAREREAESARAADEDAARVAAAARAAAKARAPAEPSPPPPQDTASKEPAASPQVRVSRETPSSAPAQPRMSREAPSPEPVRTRVVREAPAAEQPRPERAAQPARPDQTGAVREAQPREQARPRVDAKPSEAAASKPEPSLRRTSEDAGDRAPSRSFDPRKPLVTPPAEHAKPIEVGPVEEAPRTKPRPEPALSTPKPSPTVSRPATGHSSRSIAKQAVPGESPPPAPTRKAEVPGAEPASSRVSEAPRHVPAAAGRVDRPSSNGERNSVPVPPSIKEYFDSAERALAEGDEAGAVGFLKKARAEAPEDPEVRGRIALLQRRMKAGNLVRMGERKLASGSVSEALAAAKEAFALLPQAPGLTELVASLEKTPVPGTGRAASEDQPSAVPSAARRATPARAQSGDRGDAPARAQSGEGAEDYIRKVREQIALNALPNAAAIAAEGFARFPDNELLFTFTDKFRRMRLLPR